MTKSSDESEVRHVIEECVAGTALGDLARVAPHLTDDFTYFLTGEPAVRGKEAFLGALQLLITNAKMTAEVEVQEVQISGDLAYTLNWLTLTLAPLDGAPPRRRAGHTLTLLRHSPSGRWQAFRNANLLPEL
jgi:uncharacterized protein (TIGR02246 family)